MIVKQTGPNSYEVLPAGNPFMIEVVTETEIFGTTIADMTPKATPRVVTVNDSKLVDGQIVTTQREETVEDVRLTDDRLIEVGVKVSVHDVLTYAYGALDTFNDDELEQLSLRRVVEVDVPPGKVSTGWTIALVNGVLSQVHTLEDAPPPPVPNVISRRQLITQLLRSKMITDEEALGMASNSAIPAFILAEIEKMPIEAQTEAKVTVMTATQFERSNRLFRELANADPHALDEFFRAADAV